MKCRDFEVCGNEADERFTMDFTDVEPGAFIHWCATCGPVWHVRYWTDLAQAEARDAAALRARVAELEAAANTAGADASAAALRAMARATKAEAERDVLRAQVEAARAECARVHNAPRCMNAYDVATDVRHALSVAEHERTGRVVSGLEAERDALRAWVSAVSEALGAIEPVSDCRVELRADAAAALAASLRAERDALRARVFEVEQRQVGYVLVSFASHEQWKAELAELSALRARVDELKLALGAERDRHDVDGKALMQARAQVEAARTYARQALDYGEDCDATDLLAAMDEAKP